VVIEVLPRALVRYWHSLVGGCIGTNGDGGTGRQLLAAVMMGYWLAWRLVMGVIGANNSG